MAMTLSGTTGIVLPTNAAPAFSAYLFSNQTISSSTATKVQLNTETFDTNSNFDSTTNYRFTPTVAGYYQINGNLAISGTLETQCIIFLYKNGSVYLRTEWRGSAGVGSIILANSSIVYMNGSTDYLELYGYSNGSSPFFDSGSVYTSMSGALIRSA